MVMRVAINGRKAKKTNLPSEEQAIDLRGTFREIRAFLFGVRSVKVSIQGCRFRRQKI